MTKVTEAERQALYEEGVAKDAHYRTSRARETEIARLQVDTRVQADMDDRNIFYATLVDDHGFKISHIKQMMSTTNWGSAKDAVQAGRALRPAPRESEVVESDATEKYHFAPAESILTVTMVPEEFTPYKAALVETPTETTEFAFTYDGTKLLPVEDDWEHPVVTVMMLPDAQREAIAFINELH